MTGQYKVAAVFGQDSYEGAEKPTTVPDSERRDHAV